MLRDVPSGFLERVRILSISATLRSPLAVLKKYHSTNKTKQPGDTACR